MGPEEEEPALEGLVTMGDGGGKPGSQVERDASLYWARREDVSSRVGAWKKEK